MATEQNSPLDEAYRADGTGASKDVVGRCSTLSGDRPRVKRSWFSYKGFLGRQLVISSLVLLCVLIAWGGVSFYFAQRLAEIDQAISAVQTQPQFPDGARGLPRTVSPSSAPSVAARGPTNAHSESLSTQIRSLSEDRAGSRRYLTYSIWGGVVAVAVTLLLVLWRIQARFADCMDKLERKIRLIETEDESTALMDLESDSEVGAIFSALDEMATAVGARQVEQALTRHLIAEKKRVSDLVSMALGMADEVGNPLTAIEGAIDLLHKCWKENLLDSDGTRRDQGQASEYFALLRDQVTRIVWVLRQIKNLNVFSGSQRELSDINEILQSMMTLVKLDKRIHQGEIRLELDGGLPAVVLDRAQVALSFLYLIERAVDAAAQVGGRVTISSSSIDGVVDVTIYCSDMNPAACQPDDCVVPFRPGERAQQQRPDFELSSVRAAMHAHGGRLTVFCKPQTMCGIKVEFPVHPPENGVVVSEVVEELPAYRRVGGL